MTMTEITESEKKRALDLAVEAGQILLENGAEIKRVGETMDRIASSFGVEDKSFIVLGNGIIASGKDHADVRNVPIKGPRTEMVVAVNQLSRECVEGKLSLDELERRLKEIKQSKGKPWWEILLSVTIGVFSVSFLFGGSLSDATATFISGLFLGLFVVFASSHFPRMISNLLGGLIGGLVCLLLFHISPVKLHLPNLFIGTIITLVPGVFFTNGMMDLGNEDYISGATRLFDAFFTIVCIAIGISLALSFDAIVLKNVAFSGSPYAERIANKWYWTLLAAFVCTTAFSVQFGTPRKNYLDCGLTGMLGWGVYILANLALPTAEAAFMGAVTVAFVSWALAHLRKTPATVFLTCGLIPLVPGGDIFWTAYFMVKDRLHPAAETGFMALKVAAAIAGGIIIMSFLSSKIKFGKHRGV